MNEILVFSLKQKMLSHLKNHGLSFVNRFARSLFGLRFIHFYIKIFSAVLLLILTLTIPSCNTEVQTEPFEIGAEMVEITPPVGYPMYRGESSGVKTPLYAKVLVFKQGEVKGALLICDLLWIPRDLSRIVRENASKQTDIPFQNISITAIHTHTGPVIPYYFEISESDGTAVDLLKEKENNYVTDLIHWMTEAIITANNKTQPVEFDIGIGQATDISFNRRFLMTNGHVRFNPGFQNPKIVYPVGPIDPDVHFVLFRPVSQTPYSASLTVFANHCDTQGGTEFSADYPFYLQKHLRELFGNQLISVFGNGTCGNINHYNVNKPGEASAKGVVTENIGKEIAKVIEEDLFNAHQQYPDLKITSKTIFLPLQDFTIAELQWAKEDSNPLYPERAFIEKRRRAKPLFLQDIHQYEAIPPVVSGEPWQMPVEIHIFRLSEQTAIVTLPGEIFVEHGLNLKKHSPFANTMIIELANANVKYIPTRRAYAEGDYEPMNSILVPGSGEKMVEEALKMLNQMIPK